MMVTQRLISLILLLGVHQVNSQGAQERLLGGVDDCHNACTALVVALGESTVYYNSLPDGFRESYFCARQSEVNPACVIQPRSSQDVSASIGIINQHSCHFAVKSGGHAMFPGGSNAVGGITIDLKHLNGIDLSEDESTVAIGPGNRWGNVYQKLEQKGLTAVGGRVSHVGVGGFMLGGGISFLSRFKGWASDNVRNYEIVLANGSIANINSNSHPDLFWALRGGGPNFGVVTRFDLETYRQGPVWGGNVLHLFTDILGKRARFKSLDFKGPSFLSKPYITQGLGRLAVRAACLLGRCTTTDKFLKVLIDMATKGDADVPYMHLYMVFAYMSQTDSLFGSSCLVHQEPVANPPAFKEFEGLTAAHDGTKIRNLTDLMTEIDYWNSPGRYLYTPMTLKANKEILLKVLDFFIEAIEPNRGIPGLLPSLVMQPITQIARASRQKNGDNPFDIKEEDGPLILLSVSVLWSNAEDDTLVQSIFTHFMDQSIALAKEMGFHHRWIYQNYANISQDVFAGYGEKNRQKLRDIQGKYDPERIFARLQPGYFQL